MRQRANGFDGLRLFAAGLVIWGHSYPLTGHVSPGILANSVQTIGVKIFFVVSGFLIMKSWQSDPNLWHFWSKRALRIMPGLVLICILTVLILGPIFTSITISGYISNPLTLFYFWNLALYPVYFLPGVFAGNIYGPAINGSLWSLPVEVAMYAGVPLVAWRSPALAKRLTLALALALLAASIYFVRVYQPSPPPIIWGSNLVSALDAACYFYAGATFAAFNLDRFANLPVAIALFAAATITVNGYASGEIALALTLPYAAISVGTISSSALSFLKGRDYSYGLYLYGFPIEQAIVHLIGPQSAITNTMIAFPVALLLAVMSWVLVERRALSFKPRRSSSKHQATRVTEYA